MSLLLRRALCQYLAGRGAIIDFSLEMMRNSAGALRPLAPIAAAALLAAALLSGPLHAQSLTVGRLAGVVRDAAGNPVYDAEVRVVDRAGDAARTLATARDGGFRFEALPDGRYDVHVEALGYVPVRYADVRVGAGIARFVDVRLTTAAPPVTRVDTVPRRGDAGTMGQWLLERGYADLAGTRRVGADIASFGLGSDANGVEGLPWRLTGQLVDGARFVSPMAPPGSGVDGAGLALPVRGLASARVGGLGYDVEVGGTGVGLLATSRRGGGVAKVRSLAEGGTATTGAAYEIAGSLQRDTAHAVLGADYQRFERDLWDARVSDARLDERAGVYGRFDWQGSDRLAVSARASGSRYTSAGPVVVGVSPSVFGPDFEGLAAQGSVNVIGRITRRVSHEWRVAADVGRVEGAALARRGVDAMDLAPDGSALGSGFQEFRATPRVTGMLHVDGGAHRIKAGVAAVSHRVDAEYVRDRDGVFAFGEPAAATVAGTYRQVVASDADASFRMRETALFVQDDWQVVDGLTLTLGLRFDRFAIPASGIARNTEWLALSGLDNAAVSSRSTGVSPRVNFRWELGRDAAWVLEGGAGTFHDVPDVRDLSEALVLDRGADVRLGSGALPLGGTPDFTLAPVVGRTLTMLAPGFAASRTNRLSLGVTRRAGAWNASVSGVYRLTDGLGRRRDLNLPAFAAGTDQHGRPLMGQMQRTGAFVQAVPQSNRRFSAFDAVHAVDATGFSEYYGATIGVERVLERGVSFTAFYTYSRTVDNVPTLGGATFGPFANGLDGADWSEGTSDLDVPHRAMVALEWRPSDRVGLATIYRVRSGLPFTPGFRPGVDANGDGDWGNDPAFVDATLAGMDAALANNGCLEANRFAARNSCRGDFVHGLDLRASLQVARLAIGRVDLVIDAVDVLALNAAPVDAALLLVDAGSPITVNPATGVATVPYTVNGSFGQQGTGRSPGVFWRVGVRVTP